MPKGGWRNGGRPPGSLSRKPTRTVIKQIRWTEAEWAEVERRAEEAGKPVVRYQREVLLK